MPNKNYVEEIAQMILDRFFEKGATVKKEDWDFLLSALLSLESQVRGEERERLRKEVEKEFSDRVDGDIGYGEILSLLQNGEECTHGCKKGNCGNCGLENGEAGEGEEIKK